MGNYLNPFSVLILIIPVLVFPLMSFGQTAEQNSAQTQQKPQLTFSQSINRSNQELKRSKIYFLSFMKSREASYLTLAATNCANAVKTLKATQAMFPNTTRFYYQAKNKRFTACQFFEELQETASRLDPRYHIKDVSEDGCSF